MIQAIIFEEVFEMKQNWFMPLISTDLRKMLWEKRVTIWHGDISDHKILQIHVLNFCLIFIKLIRNLFKYTMLTSFPAHIWQETKELWIKGLILYFDNMWNIIDFTRNSLYVCTVIMRVLAYFQVQKFVFVLSLLLIQYSSFKP